MRHMASSVRRLITCIAAALCLAALPGQPVSAAGIAVPAEDGPDWQTEAQSVLVLELRFGILDGRTRTLEEVGKEFQVTRERIRQIEAKALRKLRHPSRSKKLRDFLN